MYRDQINDVLVVPGIITVYRLHIYSYIISQFNNLHGIGSDAIYINYIVITLQILFLSENAVCTYDLISAFLQGCLEIHRGVWHEKTGGVYDSYFAKQQVASLHVWSISCLSSWIMNQALRKCQDVTWEGQREGSADLQGSCKLRQPGENGQLAFDATRLSPSPAKHSVILKFSSQIKFASATRRSLMNLSTCSFNWVVLCKSASTKTCK